MPHGNFDRLGSRAVLQTQPLPPQIRVRNTPDSRHDSDGPEQLRFVPFADNQALTGGKDLDDGSYPHKLGPFLDAPFPARVNLVLEARPIPKHDRQVDALARM
jgi:hypothetical protein